MKEGQKRKEGEKDGRLYGWNKIDLLYHSLRKKKKKKKELGKEEENWLKRRGNEQGMEHCEAKRKRVNKLQKVGGR